MQCTKKQDLEALDGITKQDSCQLGGVPLHKLRKRRMSGKKWLFATMMVVARILYTAYGMPTEKSLVYLQSLRSNLHKGSLDSDFSSMSFYYHVNTHGSDTFEDDALCEGMYTARSAVSHSGYIGLQGATIAMPKRSFFWYGRLRSPGQFRMTNGTMAVIDITIRFFEAQDNNPHAPVILTVGGGPGVSAMWNPLMGQSHCQITSHGTTIPNPHAWTEHFNLIALDHPINVGYSYGSPVNNSRDAAYDVYNFLQRFFILFPHLLRNPLVLSSGSYGGTNVPHIATVVHEQNQAIKRGHGQRGAHHINLESIMLSNPHTDALSHYTWTLQQRCKYTDLYNVSTCDLFYGRLPFCLDAIQLVYQDPSVLENRVYANTVCQTTQLQQLEGRSYENVDRRCDGTLDECLPEGVWATQFFNDPKNKQKLGVPSHINFSLVNQQVHKDFINAGDIVQPAHLMYEPLLRAGVRLLHYVGKLDAICAWPGVISSLKLLHSPYQSAFLDAADLQWKNANATVRVVGKGAGEFTYILINDSGHMVVKDQPALAKKIADHWITNKPFET